MPGSLLSPASLLTLLYVFLQLKSALFLSLPYAEQFQFLQLQTFFCMVNYLAKALLSPFVRISQIQSLSQDHPPPKSLSPYGCEGECGFLLPVSRYG